MPTNKQQREAARRQLQRQLEARQAADARRRKSLVVITSVGVVVVLAVVVTLVVVLSGSDKSTPSASASAAAKGACTFTKSGTAAKPATLPPSTPTTTGVQTVDVTTSQGAMTFSLDPATAPCSVDSLTSLISQKYYDSTPCHRLVTEGIFVLQCGDPSGTGTGGPGYTVPDEATGNEQYPAGTIAMARSSGPNTTGSQFFIVYKDSPSLAQSLGKLQYTVVGKVTSGLDVVTKIAAGGVAAGGSSATDGKPTLDTTIQSMTLAAVAAGGGTSVSPQPSAVATASGSPVAS